VLIGFVATAGNPFSGRSIQSTLTARLGNTFSVTDAGEKKHRKKTKPFLSLPHTGSTKYCERSGM
jgi:hypothetical protein